MGLTPENGVRESAHLQSVSIEPQNKIKDTDYLTAYDENDPTSYYFREALHEPLLTREEEFHLGKIVQEGIEIIDSKRAISLDNVRFITEESQKAFCKFVCTNQRLVVSIAAGNIGRGLELLDLIEEGNFGLMNYAVKYDPERGTRFSTGATNWIKQKIQRAIFEKGKSIRLPVHVREKMGLISRQINNIRQEIGQEPSDKYIMERLNLSEPDLTSYYGYLKGTRSLQEPIGEDEDAEVGDYIEDETAQDVCEVIGDRQMKQAVRQYVREILIDERDYKIFLLRSGLFNKAMTLEEIAGITDLTRERVRQICDVCWKKLKTHRHKLEQFR